MSAVDEAPREPHPWPKRHPAGVWQHWVDKDGNTHHLSVDQWCWEHSGPSPVYCKQVQEAVR